MAREDRHPRQGGESAGYRARIERLLGGADLRELAERLLLCSARLLVSFPLHAHGIKLADARSPADKILPPEATPETKEAHLKQVPPLMCALSLLLSASHGRLRRTRPSREFPLNAEICDPEEGAILDISSDTKILVKGYAVGSKGAFQSNRTSK